MKKTSLRINFLWAFIGNGYAALCMWLLLIILAKAGDVESVGNYAIAAAVGLPISMLWNLKLQLVQVTDANKEFSFGDYLGLRIALAFFTVVTIALAGFIFYPVGKALIITAMGINYAIVAVREVFVGVMQKSERMDRSMISSVLTNTGMIILFSSLFWMTRQLAFALGGIIIARLMVLFFYDITTAKKLLLRGSGEQEIYEKGIFPLWKMPILWKLVKKAAPLGVVAWLGTLFTSIPRLTLDKTSGTEMVGYFAALSSLLVVGNMFMGALGQTVSPRLSRYFIESPKGYIFLLLKLMAFVFLLSGIGITVSVFWGKSILSILFTPAYADYSDIFVLIMIAGSFLFLFSCLNIALTSARRFMIQPLIYAFSALTCGIASFYLIPKYEVKGAAWSLFLCYMVGSLLMLFTLWLALKKQKRNVEGVNV